MLLLIDNYDSFAHNLARYFRQLGQATTVVRNDRITIAQIRSLNPAAIVMSPGPGTPDQAGICVPLVEQLYRQVPLLGVCLGHQAICQALGASVVRTRPVHGRPGQLHHTGHALFAGVPSPFTAGRYHSLTVAAATIPDSLEVVATLVAGDKAAESDDGVMAVVHRQYPVTGFQFHPESVLTADGHRLLANFLVWAGIVVGQPSSRRPRDDRESGRSTAISGSSLVSLPEASE